MENKYEKQVDRPLRVYGYLRVVTSWRLDGLSGKQQRNLIEKRVAAIPNAELIDIYADTDIPYRDLTCHHEALRLSKKCRDGEVDLILAATPLSTTKFINSAMAYTILLKSMEAPIQFTNGKYYLDRVPERSWVSLIDTPESVLRDELLMGIRS